MPRMTENDYWDRKNLAANIEYSGPLNSEKTEFAKKWNVRGYCSANIEDMCGSNDELAAFLNGLMVDVRRLAKIRGELRPIPTIPPGETRIHELEAAIRAHRAALSRDAEGTPVDQLLWSVLND